ncbi:hypothetical protein [Endozoicomonas sp. Mp262]|uniref:hypothetical protein n=1 Tax=Endozoicomonas sp. Mp262 TaxID=2919499 RepID=UPI0021DA63AA
MTDIIWPAELGKPLKQGYSYTLGIAQTTKNILGASRSRTTSAKHLTVFTCNYLWTDEQLAVFRQFCKDHITDWFAQELKLGGDIIPQTVRIADVQPAKRDQFRWKVSLKLDCIDRYIIPDELAELIMQQGSEVGSSIKSSERYRRVINYELPEIF